MGGCEWMSLSDLLEYSPILLNSMVFEVFGKTNEHGNQKKKVNPLEYKYKFVQVKVQKIVDDTSSASCIETNQLIIQLTDVSGKILYNEAKAKQSFVTMMQASTSHEIRNPLASLIYKLSDLRNYLKQHGKM